MKAKFIILALAIASLIFSTEARMPIHSPAHPIGRTMYHHRPAPKARPVPPKPAPRPVPHHPVRPRPMPLDYHYRTVLPYWYFMAAAVHHSQPIVGPVRQVQIWVDGHYETEIQPNGQSFIVWIPGHYELVPVR